MRSFSPLPTHFRYVALGLLGVEIAADFGVGVEAARGSPSTLTSFEAHIAPALVDAFRTRIGDFIVNHLDHLLRHVYELELRSGCKWKPRDYVPPCRGLARRRTHLRHYTQSPRCSLRRCRRYCIFWGCNQSSCKR